MYNKNMQQLGQTGSAIRELFEYGKTRKAIVGDDNVFDFSIGNPSVPCPNVVTNTLVDLITKTDPVKLHGYTSASGDIEVKTKIVEYLNMTYHCNENPNLVYLTVGAAASLTITFNALLNPGDEVIVFAPFFPEYKVFIEKALGKIVIVEPDEKTFYPNLEKLEQAINENTKAVLIDSPNNPTGVILPHDVIEKISNLLRNKERKFNKNIYLISDEPYRELIYNDIKYPFITNYYHNSIVCYSFSKSLSLPGERIGYILVADKCDKKEGIFQAICGAGRALGFVCAPSLFQYMIPNCLGYTSNIEIYKQNRDLLYNYLTNVGYEVVKPDGAFYLFVKALEKDAVAFSNCAKKYDLLLVPSDSFGYAGYVRISYCVSTKMIEKALPIFKKLYDDYQNK